MKTIVSGNKDALKEYKYFECKRCGWAGKADKTEYTYCGDQREGDNWKVKCPCCAGAAHFVEGVRLQFLRTLEQKNDINYWENG